MPNSLHNYPGVDARQLQKSVSQIAGGIHARSGYSRMWSKNYVLHLLDCFLKCLRVKSRVDHSSQMRHTWQMVVARARQAHSYSGGSTCSSRPVVTLSPTYSLPLTFTHSLTHALQLPTRRARYSHSGVDLRANLKSISHRYHLFVVAFVWQLTNETICLPLGCLQGGFTTPPDSRGGAGVPRS